MTPADGAAIRVLLCEDQTLMRQGLRTILDLEPGLTVVGEAADGPAAVARALALRPDVVLMDVQLPGQSGIAATAAITREAPEVRVIILTTFDLREYVVEGLQAGAAGFLLKDAPADDLVAAIRRVHAGEQFVQPDVAARMLTALGQPTPAEPEGLTEREVAVLRLLAAGASNRTIADRLALAEGTVKNYVSSILDKLAAANRTQAVAIARERGLL
ncbi:MAG TPA: response regulator transcription factor [Thermomicrobiales bacterium]|nr:response regulator transcription factor [Thermomicrobiales bacterium]